jgi:large subunit ribosomal protein L31
MQGTVTLAAAAPTAPTHPKPGKEAKHMKQGIHPDYKVTSVTCSCGNTFVTRGVQDEIRVELCNQCHPFYTGKQKLVDSGGRVERYKQRYAKTEALKQPQAVAPQDKSQRSGGKKKA